MDKFAVNERVLSAISKILATRSDVNKTSLATSLGIKPAKFSEILNGRMMAGTDIMSRLCTIYGVNAQWLLTGVGGMHITNEEVSAPIVISENDKVKDFFSQFDKLIQNKDLLIREQAEQIRTLSSNPEEGTPYYDVDFMGGFDEIINSQTIVPDCNIIVPGFEKATVWCNVTGHSMDPKICHGDIIALRECTKDDIQYGEIYAVVLDTLRTIKILRRGSTPDVLRYVPINPDFDDQEFPISRILNIFEVLGSVARFF